jgi:hypothetical protein
VVGFFLEGNFLLFFKKKIKIKKFENNLIFLGFTSVISANFSYFWKTQKTLMRT